MLLHKNFQCYEYFGLNHDQDCGCLHSFTCISVDSVYLPSFLEINTKLQIYWVSVDSVQIESYASDTVKKAVNRAFSFGAFGAKIPL